MTKAEYFNEVRKIVKKAIADKLEAQEALDDVNEKLNHSKRYSADYIRDKLRPMQRNLERQLRDAHGWARDEVEKLTANYMAEIQAQNHLDGAALTDDAKLFSVGVKLRDSDLEKLFDKYNGNFTMQRLVCDYAQQNDVKINRVLLNPNGDLIEVVKQIPYVAEKCAYWHKKPDFYEQFMGENSDFAKIMGA